MKAGSISFGTLTPEKRSKVYTFAQAARNLETRGKERPSPENRPPKTVQEPRKKEALASTPREVPSASLEAAVLGSMTLEELGRKEVVLTVWSEVLEDTVLLVPNHYRPGAGDPVTYTAHELASLLHAEEASLRAVHGIKKVLGGRVLWTKELPPKDRKSVV